MNWQFISFFGDSTVLLPSAALLLIVLLLRKPSQILAWQWGFLFAVTGVVVSVSKLAFMGWGLGIRDIDFTGFSGHSALSAAFWPVFLWLLAARLNSGIRMLFVILGYALALLVAVSRLEINAHSVSEVIAGVVLGASASALFLLFQKRFPHRGEVRLSWGAVASLVLIPAMLLHTGVKAPTQSMLGEIAVALGPLDKPFTRADLHKRAW